MKYCIHTVLLACRDNEGHEQERLHSVLERALAGLGLPDTVVDISPTRIVMRTRQDYVRLPAKRYAIYDVARLGVAGTHGYISAYALESAVAEICAGTDIVYRVVPHLVQG